jgi:hypothetical protein
MHFKLYIFVLSTAMAGALFGPGKEVSFETGYNRYIEGRDREVYLYLPDAIASIALGYAAPMMIMNEDSFHSLYVFSIFNTDSDTIELDKETQILSFDGLPINLIEKVYAWYKNRKIRLEFRLSNVETLDKALVSFLNTLKDSFEFNPLGLIISINPEERKRKREARDNASSALFMSGWLKKTKHPAPLA